MILKKLAALAAGGTLLLATAVPAFADVVILNGAGVLNEIMTAANSGGNVIAGEIVVDGGSITSGDAGSLTDVTNVVNSNDVNEWSWDCGCDDVAIENGALVGNGVVTMANTGENTITGGLVGGGSIVSGDAGAASVVTNVVNTNMVDTWWPVI